MRIRVIPAVATLATAALLVVGVDYATFAANGSSLVLGRINHERTRTVLVKHDAGPALRLVTRGNRQPSLAVSSRARVPRLNADRLDGHHASALATRTVTFRAGRAGADYDGVAVWRLAVRPGLYAASFRVGLQPAEPDQPAFEVICGLADFNTIGETTTVYTAETGTNSGVGAPTLMSGAETVRITAAADPVAVCTRPTDGGSFTFFAPLTTSWTRINQRTVRTAPPVAVDMRSQRLLTPAR